MFDSLVILIAPRPSPFVVSNEAVAVRSAGTHGVTGAELDGRLLLLGTAVVV